MVSREILENYVFNREKPPLLFIAILANDLHGASTILQNQYGKDTFSLNQLLDIVSQVHRFVPSEARGSLFKIEQWIGKPI
jgi:hypothetical protein